MIADEVIELATYGLDRRGRPRCRVLAGPGVARSQRHAREGSEADFVVYDADPLDDLAILKSPRHIVLRGKVVA